MSESREHKNRMNQKLEFIAEFEKWMDAEPSRLRIIKHNKWKRNRPTKPWSSVTVKVTG